MIWVRPSEQRPHSCREHDKGDFKYYIREAAETKEADDQQEKRLCRENSTPFDDRLAIDSGKKTYSTEITLEIAGTRYRIASPSLREYETLVKRVENAKR